MSPHKHHSSGKHVASHGKAKHFSHALHHRLVRKGIQSDVAAALSAALIHAAKFAYDNANGGLKAVELGHAVKEGRDSWKVWGQAKHLLSGPIMGQGVSRAGLVEKIAESRASFMTAGMEIVIAGLEHFKIEHNKCALSFGKVTLDASGFVAGGLEAETVAGGIFAAISAHAASEDSMELVTECFGVPKEKQEQTRDDAMSMRTINYRP